MATTAASPSPVLPSVYQGMVGLQSRPAVPPVVRVQPDAIAPLGGSTSAAVRPVSGQQWPRASK